MDTYLMLAILDWYFDYENLQECFNEDTTTMTARAVLQKKVETIEKSFEELWSSCEA